MVKGKAKTCLWNGVEKTLTQILDDPKVQSYVKGNTYASKREKLRQLLRDNKITPNHVNTVNVAAAQPIQDTRYGTQRRTANLPKKNTRGQVLY